MRGLLECYTIDGELSAPPRRIWQMIEVTRHVRGLRGRRGRSHPGRVLEVEELRHVSLGSVALSKAPECKTCFDEFENCRVVHDGMGNIVLPRERGDDQSPHSEAGEVEISGN